MQHGTAQYFFEGPRFSASHRDWVQWFQSRSDSCAIQKSMQSGAIPHVPVLADSSGVRLQIGSSSICGIRTSLMACGYAPGGVRARLPIKKNVLPTPVGTGRSGKGRKQFQAVSAVRLLGAGLAAGQNPSGNTENTNIRQGEIGYAD